MRNRIIAILITAVLGMSLFAGAAQAFEVHWKVSNSSKSVTGAIYHKVKNDKMYGKAIIREVGAGDKTVRMNLDGSGKAQMPFGLKVWQPKGSCLKTYVKFGPVWLRTHNYKKQSYGRDVWVTKGLSDTGDRLRVKILHC